MRVCITNCYSSLNRGDAAIVLALIDVIKSWRSSAQISIISFTPIVDRTFYQKDIRVLGDDLSWFLDPDVGKLRKASALCARFMDLAETDYGQAIKDSDIVIACGGGYLNDNYGAMIETHLHQLHFARSHRIPYILANQSLGPFRNRLYSWQTSILLRHASSIVLREERSVEWARRLKVPDPLYSIAPDLAFSMKVPAPLQETAKDIVPEGKGPLIGVTARRWVFPGSQSSAASQDRFQHELAKALKSLIEVVDARIVLVPQVVGPYRDDDRQLNETLQSLLSDAPPGRITSLSSDYDPRSLRQFIGRLDLLIGTRMHSNIFALTEFVPVVAVAYEHKTRGIMSSIGLEEYVLDIVSLRAQDLVSKAIAALDCRGQISETLKLKIPNFVEKSPQPLLGALDEIVNAL